MARGKFITFEGGEGAGKSTQARMLREHLSKSGFEVVVTREPGGSPFAERVRDILLDAATPSPCQLAEVLMFNAARADHLDRVIRPALERGRWVICDRFIDSTRVYQGEVGGVDREVLDALDQMVVAKTRPDITFMVDLDPVIGLARVAQRSAQAAGGITDRYESRNAAYHENLRDGFIRVARSDPVRCVIVDGFRSVDDLAREIRGHVDARLLRGGR